MANGILDKELKEYKNNEICHFINFVRNSNRFDLHLPYDIWLFADNGKETRDFAESFTVDLHDEIIRKAKYMFKGLTCISEEDFMKSFETVKNRMRKNPLNRYVYIIYDFDGTDSEKWQDILAILEQYPCLHIFICSSREYVRKTYGDENPFFFKAVSRYIKKKPMDTSEIERMLIRNLDGDGYEMTVDFHLKISEYIENTYPESEYKEEKYVDDLIGSIRTLLFIKEDTAKVLDEECVPYYCCRPRTQGKCENVGNETGSEKENNADDTALKDSCIDDNRPEEGLTDDMAGKEDIPKKDNYHKIWFLADIDENEAVKTADRLNISAEKLKIYRQGNWPKNNKRSEEYIEKIKSSIRQAQKDNPDKGIMYVIDKEIADQISDLLRNQTVRIIEKTDNGWKIEDR